MRKIQSVTVIAIFTIVLLTWPREVTTYVNLSDGYAYDRTKYFLLGNRHAQGNRMFSEQFLSLIRTAFNDSVDMPIELEVRYEKVQWSLKPFKRDGPDYHTLTEINKIRIEWLSNDLTDDEVVDSLRLIREKGI